MNKPNILLLMGDEHPVFMTGCYGHRSVKTPTLDRLAEQGTIFDAAYCPSPICAPSRASMMTGKYVHKIETWDNAAPLRSDWPTFAHSFRSAGYSTIGCGKMHFVGPDQLHGFCERWTQDIYPATFNWTRSNRNHVAYNPGQNIDRVFECGEGWSYDMDYDEEVIFRAEYGLRQIIQEKNKEPFFLCVSFASPHYPFKAPEKYWNLYTDGDIDLPEIPEDYLEREHEYIKWLRYHGRFDQLVPDDICRKARRAILGRITMLDDYLARIITLLQKSGLDKNTIIVYTSDHGDMMGEHGLWFKNTSYEWSSRVPFIITGPNIPKQRISECVSLLDLGPTLCSLADIEPVYTDIDGRDVSDLIYKKREGKEGKIIVENYGEGIWKGVRTIRLGKYKLTYIHGYEAELFNLLEDPNEWNNLANDSTYKFIKDELVNEILKNWDPVECDERRYQSEERRLAILKALEKGPHLDWQKSSSSLPHPLPWTRKYMEE